MSAPTTSPRQRRTSAAERRRAARRGTVALAAVALVALVAGCSLQRDEPARVTLPEMGTSTTQPPSGPDRIAPAPESEPLPVAWIVQVGGPGDEELLALTGHQASVVAVGSTTGSPEEPIVGASDVLVATITTSGELTSATPSGSTGADVARGVASEERAIACGETDGALGAGAAGRFDAWCSPIDEAGSLVTPTQLGGPEDERATGAGTAPGAGQLYVSGTLAGLLPGAQDPSGRGLGGGDALMMQVDAEGRPVWARQFGTGLEDGALAATADPGGDGLVAGYTDGDLEGRSRGGRDGWISRFDPSGNQRWIAQLGSSGTDVFTAVTTAGEARRGTERIVAVGTTDADIDAEGPGRNAGLNDAVAAAVGTDGDLVWITQFGSSFEETVAGVAADGSTVYVTGSTGDGFGDLLDDGGPGGARDGFLAAIDAETGAVLWVSRFGSEGDETMTGLAVTEDGLLVASGTTTGRMGSEPAGGGLDGFVIAFPLSSAGGGAASSV